MFANEIDFLKVKFGLPYYIAAGALLCANDSQHRP